VNIEIISATQKTRAEFSDKSALGLSLQRLGHDRRLVARIATDNTRGLSAVYNEFLDLVDGDSIAVFMHDDVWIDDYFFSQRILEALSAYDVIGVAGNRRRVPKQPAWAFVTPQGKWDDAEHLTGAIACGSHPFGSVNYYGSAPAECALLDGMFLAAKKSTLVQHNVAFDPRFDFDFYDMDFCRSASQNGIRLGTWPICLTHMSSGRFGSERWMKGYQTYIDKWRD
jgi:GT2 family glycosyltransferase